MAAVKFTIVGDPIDLRVSQCTFCAHRSDDGTYCEAFPQGIPFDLLHNRHDHRLEYPGDNGTRYTPVVLEETAKVPA